LIYAVWEYFEHKNTQISEKNEFFLRKNAFFLIFCLQFLKLAVILQSKNKPFFFKPNLYRFKFMNKTELVNAIAAKAGLTQAQAKSAIDATVEAISEAVAKGDKITLIGFGTFSVVEKGARQGINPATKQKIEIPARKAVKFKAGAELAAKVK
jgi:DNA-binding protein HU-beta